MFIKHDQIIKSTLSKLRRKASNVVGKLSSLGRSKTSKVSFHLVKMHALIEARILPKEASPEVNPSEPSQEDRQVSCFPLIRNLSLDSVRRIQPGHQHLSQLLYVIQTTLSSAK